MAAVFSATEILWRRGFRPSRVAMIDGEPYTKWTGRDGELKVSLRTADGTTRIFTEEFAASGELRIVKDQSTEAQNG